MEHLAPDGPFDRELTLREFLAKRDGAKLMALMGAVLNGAVCVRDARGEVLLGAPMSNGVRAAVRGALEPIGSLEAAAPTAAVEAVARLLERLFVLEMRYRMASSLHLEAVQSDFEKLKAQHAALAASEERYRQLAANLQAQVQEQVKTLEAAQRQLYQAEKLASVGQLAAGIAHEINTPIGFIQSNLRTAQRYRDTLAAFYRTALPRGRADLEELFNDFGDLLGESLEGTERVARIVAALKDFSRVDRSEVAMVDLNRVVRNAIEVVRPQGMDRIEFVAELAPLPPYRCHAGQLGEVVLNVLTNAVQAIDGAGKIHVRTTAAPEQIAIAIEDTGRGIDPAHLQRIFDPFFTTKEVGSGTGLGLTVSNDIVRAHGGRIDVTSTPGKGTRVAVSLPRGNNHE